jgi:ketosteroid isomerase-like protein
MSQENVEVVRRGYAELSRTGEFIWELIGPDVEVHDPPLTPDARVYRGHAGLREAMHNVELAFEEVRFEAEDFFDAGDDVVVFVRMIGRGRESGVDVDARIAHLWTVRGGMGVRVSVLDRDQALAAVGLAQ